MEKRFTVRLLRYPRWLVVLMVGLSCACFWSTTVAGTGALVTFCASYRYVYSPAPDPSSMHPQM